MGLRQDRQAHPPLVSNDQPPGYCGGGAEDRGRSGGDDVGEVCVLETGCVFGADMNDAAPHVKDAASADSTSGDGGEGEDEVDGEARGGRRCKGVGDGRECEMCASDNRCEMCASHNTCSHGTCEILECCMHSPSVGDSEQAIVGGQGGEGGGGERNGGEGESERQGRGQEGDSIDQRIWSAQRVAEEQAQAQALATQDMCQAIALRAKCHMLDLECDLLQLTQDMEIEMARDSEVGPCA